MKTAQQLNSLNILNLFNEKVKHTKVERFKDRSLGRLFTIRSDYDGRNNQILKIIFFSTAALTMMIPNAAASETCDSGYYKVTDSSSSVSYCKICPAGKYCPDTTQALSCSSGTYSLPGQTSCTSCPSGFICPNTDDLPESCPQGTYPSSDKMTCTSCAIGYACQAPDESATVCSAPSFFTSTTGQSECFSCPAGSSCTSTSSTTCSSGYHSAQGMGTCTQASAGYFAPNIYSTDYACPGGTYTNSQGATSCNLCPTGKSCSSTSGTPSSCSSKTFSPLGTTDCEQCYNGYECYSTSEASMQPCFDGYYSSSGVCTKCPDGYYCNDTSIVGKCPTGTYSIGRGCMSCPNLYACSDPASISACNSTSYVDPSTSTCKNCETGYVCGSDFISPRKCPKGYYTPSNDLNTCTICPEGYYCPTQNLADQCPADSISGQGWESCIQCPAGYDCSTSQKLSEITQCSEGSYSLKGETQCTTCAEGETCPFIDETKQTCVAGTYLGVSKSTESCNICEGNSKCNGDGLISSTTCQAGEYSPFGSEQCNDCRDGTCTIDSIGQYMDCSPGYYYDQQTTSCKVCESGYECNNNTRNICPNGKIYSSLYSKCIECPSDQICIYSSSGSLTNNYCYGKDPTQTVIISNFTNANRLSNYNYTYCIDCNSDSLMSKLCTFATNYFTTQAGSNITCPEFRSEKSSLNDYRFWDYDNSDFPYCKQSTSLYSPVSSKINLVSSSTCYRTTSFYQVDYGVCREELPGFVSSSSFNPNTQTDSPIEGYYSIFEQGDYGTLAVVKECSDNLELVTKGGSSESQACKIRETGSCIYDGSDYCHDGDEFQCLIGYTGFSDYIARSNKTDMDCVQCTAGKYCNLESVNQTCEAGYSCPKTTEDASQYPSRPGKKITSTGSTVYTSEITCTSGYCPSASSSETECPDGYTLDVTNNAHNIFNCHPNSKGLYYNSDTSTSTACTAGYYCPEGLQSSDSMIPCPPGHYSDSTSRWELSQCTACPAGKFCDEGSTSSNQENCPSGFYCTNRTRFMYENACLGGTYSSSSTNASTSDQCLTCTQGYYCKEGSGSLTVCPKNAYCPTSSTHFTDCALGYNRSSTGGTSSSSCTACPDYKLCPGGADPISCPPGFSGANNDNNTDSRYMNCIPATNGSYTTDYAVIQATCPDGKYSYETADECSDCPEGHYCKGGVLYDCPAGQYCPPGSSSPQTCSSGTYCTELNQNRIYQCPSGQYCTSGSSPVSTPPGYYNVQGETSSTSNTCGSGYNCTGGATGPYQNPCPINTYARSSDQSCQACSAGKNCKIGSSSQGDCPLGYYCTGTDSQPQKCPAGTYGATTNLASANDCTPCPPGKVCSQTGLTEPDGLCDPGYYCTGGSWTSQPDEDNSLESQVGGLCPNGSYCPEGSSSPQSCPSGTYNSFPGMRSSSDCISCTPGFYCEGSSNPNVTGSCQAGYYCIGGSSNATQYQAQPGNYSITGSSSQIQCQPGTYSSIAGASSCTQCDAGKYCDELGMSSGVDCPAGYYCPTGTINPLPCPIGTYNPTAASSNQDSCLNCTGGSYCDEEGLTYVKGECEAGYFCTSGSPTSTPVLNLTVTATYNLYINSYGLCPRGFYCEEGTTNPVACPTGYYLDSEGGQSLSDCKICPEGYFCSQTGLTTPEGQCSANYYCPAGTTTATPSTYQCQSGFYCPVNSAIELKCPAGTFEDSILSSSCASCSDGYYCNEGATSETICPVGSYCPSGTKYPIQYQCPEGTLNQNTQQTDSSSCATCPANLYCRIPGASAQDEKGVGLILNGYYNQNGGSTSPIPSTSTGALCSPGYYCLEGQQIACDAGKYCNDYGLYAVVGDCYKGYYCESGSDTMTPIRASGDNGDVCPQSHYCETGTVTPTECPVGTFSDGTGLFASSDCSKCPAGYICDLTAANFSELTACPPGSYCESGTNSSSSATNCRVGYYCPLGSTGPTPCPAGTYNDQTGQTSCQTCLSGTYCPYASDSGLNPADGYYVNQTGQPAPKPCPPKYYQPSSGDNSCSICPAGYYCDQYAIVGPLDSSRQCPAGFYCPEGTSDYSVNLCSPGYYCPAGSSTQTSCDPGKYCPDYGLETYAGDCEAGYYCIGNATKPNPEDKLTGGLCPSGYYCPAGSFEGTACPSQKYNDKEGATDENYCLDCPNNKICEGTGLSTYTESCPGGYTCETINGVLSETLCEKGYSCPEGYLSSIKCQPGTYQDDTGQSSCKTCPEGYYCYEDSGAVIITPKDCPAGFFCPAGTALYSSNPCPLGTYSNKTKLISATQCTNCDYGYYCNQLGLTNNSGICLDGYVCKEGSQTATGTKLCPANYYCIGGVEYECPQGTYNKQQGATSQQECVKCPPGKVCPNHFTSIVDCPPGYYCEGGLYSTSQATICPNGHYCPTGSYSPKKCEAGTYQNSTGKYSCEICPEGKFCNDIGMSTPTDCSVNMTCSSGSILPKSCSYGYYADSSNVCQKCPAGSFCWPDPRTNGIAGQCEAGYVCQSGSYSPRPYQDLSQMKNTSATFSTYNGPSYPGYYSTDGKTNLICPIGTMQVSMWGKQCQSCYPGYYCPMGGMSTLSKNFQCPAAYKCTGGNTGYDDEICPSGYTSVAGQPHCLTCIDGYYATNERKCQLCPSNSYCNNTLVYSGGTGLQKCTSGQTCLGGNTYQPVCSDGYYLQNKQCDLCPAGKYCLGGTQAGNCQAGYYCYSGDTSPTPSNDLCDAGYYCPHGTTQQRKCPYGYYRVTEGGIQKTDCSSCVGGYLCSSKQGKPNECPAGFYCPYGATEEQPCPLGTYSDLTMLITKNDCKNCPAGYFCNETNITDFSLYPCSKGKYCPERSLVEINCPAGTYRNVEGAKTVSECFICPAGYYCPEGTSEPINCAAGTYCPEGSEYFTTCRGGYYCNSNTNYQEEICPINYYCPRGSENPLSCTGRLICLEGQEIGSLCDAGNYVQFGEFEMTNECVQCPAGTYSIIQDQDCQPCTAGYLCYGGTNRKYPTSFTEHNGEICPKGYYCEKGSSVPQPCPSGTYNAEFGASSLTQCLLCPENTFNDLSGQSGCKPCGAYASSIEGQSSCYCKGNYRTFSFSDSSCRCMSGYDYIDPVTEQSQGKTTGTGDCTPLVYERCDGTNQVRDPSGDCVDVNNCTSFCDGGTGVRSATLGICTCDSKPSVDVVCNQNCRQSATQLTVKGSTSTIQVTDSKGKTVNVSLSSIGDVYGSFECDSGNCSVKSTEMSSNGGFYGTYGASSVVEKKAKRLLRRNLQQEDPQDMDNEFRELQSTTEVNTASIKNPIVCINKGDSMLFTITNPKHYPVYQKDSVMNSNPNFDYGSFLLLTNQMITKQANNNTTPTLFAFTFTDSGSYVFVDGSDSNSLMIVKVVDQGETCPDPDRYIQPLSSESASQVGVKHKDDIIVKPDIPLLVGMSAILVLSVVTVMVSVGYCLHKGWKIRKASKEGYRSKYFKVNVDHTNDDTFVKNNDFAKYKTNLGDSDEDDLDNINLDIHQDLLDAGQEYLKVFDDKKLKRAQEKKAKKEEILRLMKELEEMIQVIGSDAVNNQMQYYNPNEFDDPNAMQMLDDEEAERLRQKELKLNEEKEKRDQENDKKRREQMMQEWSDRDRTKLIETKDKMQQKADALKKELNSNIQRKAIDRDVENEKFPKGRDGEDLAMAIYDNGDVNSRQNQIVRMIDQNKDLTDEEKESLLRAHQKNLLTIEDILEIQRKKQEFEMEKALKDRIDKRKRALEQQFKKQINQEVKEHEKEIREDIDNEKDQQIREVEAEIQAKMDDLTKNNPKSASYRQWIEDLKKERDLRKKQIEQEFQKAYEDRVNSMKEDVTKKWTQGVNSDEELEQMIRDQIPGAAEALEKLKAEKAEQEQQLNEAMKERKKDLKTRLQEERQRFEEENQQKDPLKEEEIEKKKKEILRQKGIIDDQEQGIDDPLAKFNKVLSDLDSQLQVQTLLDQFKNKGEDIEAILKQNENDQKQKLNARRELLRQRKLISKQTELEASRIQERMKQIQTEDEMKAKIEKAFIKGLFEKQKKFNQQNDDGSATLNKQQQQQQQLMIFNEYISDAFLQRLSNLLMKQFLENEVTLKLILQRYMDQRLIEKSNIKQQFRNEYNKLNALKPHLTEQEYQEALKTLKLKQENMLRDLDLQFDRAFKEEEIKVRSELEKKHTDEQINLRKEEMQEQINLKKELFLMDDKDEELDKKALKAYEDNKKREQERKLRNLGLQKQEILKAIDKDLQNKYTDFEELLRRKREEEAVMQEQTLSIRKKLQDRKRKIREQGGQGISREEQLKMLEQHQHQLEALDSVLEEERRRQLLIMNKKMTQKKAKQEKMDKMKALVDEQEIDQIKEKLGNALEAQMSQQQMQPNAKSTQEDTELYRQLKNWSLKRQEIKKQEEERLLAETTVDLDPITLKKLIMKLDNLEKGLRQLRKLQDPAGSYKASPEINRDKKLAFDVANLDTDQLHSMNPNTSRNNLQNNQSSQRLQVPQGRSPQPINSKFKTTERSMVSLQAKSPPPNKGIGSKKKSVSTDKETLNESPGNPSQMKKQNYNQFKKFVKK